MRFLKNLWAKIRSLFRLGADPYDLYQPAERLLYSYWNGQETVKADPMALYRKMMDVGPELAAAIKISKFTSVPGLAEEHQRKMRTDASKARDEMLGYIREIFRLKPYEEGGPTELETVELLDHFMTYCHEVKKNSSPSPTTSGEPASTPTMADVPPMPKTSGSGSVETGPTTAAPASSRSECESPSV